jgi:hypothetical protein
VWIYRPTNPGLNNSINETSFGFNNRLVKSLSPVIDVFGGTNSNGNVSTTYIYNYSDNTTLSGTNLTYSAKRINSIVRTTNDRIEWIVLLTSLKIIFYKQQFSKHILNKIQNYLTTCKEILFEKLHKR